MATSTVSRTTTPLPREILEFALAEGVEEEHLQAVLEMTRATFPRAEVSVRLERDPEIAETQRIVLGVKAKELEVAQALDARYHWHAELFHCCPAPRLGVFQLALQVGR